MLDPSLDLRLIGKELVNCMHKARDGVDAFLVVISIRNRFAEDDKAAISTLSTLFGRKFYDCMIIVFTGGDELEDDNESLEDFLRESPKVLQETLGLCGNRCVLFDNRTKNPTKRSNQAQKLLSFVNIVSKNNGGKGYTNEIFSELKKLTRGLDEEEMSASGEQFRLICEMVELKLMAATLKLEQLLEEERNARKKTEEDIQKLREELKEARKREEELKEAMKRDEEFRKKIESGVVIYCDLTL